MYKKEIKENNLFDFNEAFGVKLDEENRWIKKSKMIPWEKIEKNMPSYFKVMLEMLQNHLGWH